MSYFPIKLDKIRNLKYGMRAIDLIEKEFKKPVMKIDGVRDGALSMHEYATIIWAGLVHEDDKLTPGKVMDLVDEYSSLAEIGKTMWDAFNSVFESTEGDVEEEKNE